MRALFSVVVCAWIAAAIAAPAAHAAALPYPTKCGTNPVCGTDEGDDLYFTGEPGPIQFFGENGHDTVAGSVFGDHLVGGGGNDEIFGDRGDDVIDGGDDSDVLYGGPGNDTLRERRFGFDTIYGGPGDDVLAGGRANDKLYGGTGNDVLYGGSGSDHLYGGPGNDTLYGGPNRDTFDCGPGDDTVYIVRRDTGSTTLERHDSFVPKSAGCEHVIDGDPTATFPLRDRVGTDGNDVIAGDDGPDLIEGKGGSDKLDGRGGNDELEGDGASNQGNDLLIGGAGDDRLAGRGGDDKLFGDTPDGSGPQGNDELVGGSGRDLLVGGGGNDAIFGAYDGDRILAGAGNDVVSLLGGDTTDPNGTVYVDCGPGLDVVIINPARRGTYKRCEYFATQWHEADFGNLLRPSPEVFAPGQTPASAASIAQPPAAPDGSVGPPSISADGSRVAFSSDAGNLIADDTNAERTDPFVRDMATNQTMAADSLPEGGVAIYGGRFRRGPSGDLSADGRFAVFTSRSSDLGRGNGYRIWVRDLRTGSTEQACRQGNGPAENPVISADGRHIAFESDATNLAGSDTDQQTDVYWCDMNTGELRRVSSPITDGVDTVGTSLEPSISADGRYVAFTSDAGGLVPGDDGRAGVYWRDMQSGEIRTVDADGIGEHPHISSDGRFVAFDTESGTWRWDMTTGTATSVMASPGTADSISVDGNRVGISAQGSVWVRDMTAPGALLDAGTDANGTRLAGPSFAAAISADGRYLAFVSGGRVYRKDTAGGATGALDLVSAGIDLAPRSLISEPLGTLPRRKARFVRGTTEDDGVVVRVDVSMSRPIGSGRCLWLGRGSRIVRAPCSKPVWMRATLDSGLRFTLRIRRGRPLLRGTWRVRTRATDDTGQIEPPRPDRNLVSVRLR